MILDLEEAMPEIRPAHIQRRLDTLKRSDFSSDAAYNAARVALVQPSDSVVSRLCKQVGISWQRSQASKHDVYRDTWQAELRHFRDNANRFRVFVVIDEIGFHLRASPRYSYGIRNGSGVHLRGETRGPGVTAAVAVMYDM